MNPFIVAVVTRANELPRAEAARLVLQGCGRARSAVRAEFEKGVQMSPFDHYMYVLAAVTEASTPGMRPMFKRAWRPTSLVAAPSTPSPMRPFALSLGPGFTRKLVR